MANMPMGQKQNRQESTDSIMLSGGGLWATNTVVPDGWVT